MTAEPRGDAELLRRTDAMRANADRVRAYPSYSVRQLADDARWLMGEYAERLGQLAAADRENAELRGEVERLRPMVEDTEGVILRKQEDVDEIATQLAAAQAQLAEVQRAVGYLLLCHDTSSAQASDWLSAWRTAGAVMARATGYDGPALSAAPQPELADGCAECTESGTRNCVAGCKPEPPASAEPTGRSD